MERIKKVIVHYENGQTGEWSGQGQVHDINTVIPGDTPKDNQPIHYIYLTLVPKPVR